MKLTTAGSLLAFTLSTTINTVAAIPQFPPTDHPTVQDTIRRPTYPNNYRQPSDPSSSPYYNSNDRYYDSDDGRSSPYYNRNDRYYDSDDERSSPYYNSNDRYYDSDSDSDDESSYYNSNDRYYDSDDPNNPYDSYVSISFTIPEGRTFTDTFALDESGYGSLRIHDRGYYNHIIQAEIVRSPARFPTNACYLFVSGFEHDGDEIDISRRQQYHQLPFDLEREYGSDDAYYVGAVLYCASDS